MKGDRIIVGPHHEKAADVLSNHHVRTAILQQDDYFVYPPKSNAAMRRKDINHVGPSEVRLDLMDENLKQVMAGARVIVKPLVDYDADSIGEESVELDHAAVVLVEGTYTTLLENVHRRVFIDRTREETREARTLRGREAQDDYLERILAIEHDIISLHKPRADFIVSRDYSVTTNESRG
jgi:uridine kinase